MKTSHKTVKAAERRRRIRKEVNIRRNNLRGSPPFVLEVELPEGWKPVMGFRTMEEVRGYVAEQEDLRQKDACDIVEGRVTRRSNGKVVARIPPHKASRQDAPEKDVSLPVSPAGARMEVGEVTAQTVW